MKMLEKRRENTNTEEIKIECIRFVDTVVLLVKITVTSKNEYSTWTKNVDIQIKINAKQTKLMGLQNEEVAYMNKGRHKRG